MRRAARFEKCATLPRVCDFDMANPWEGLRVTPAMCHLTTRSIARPGESIVKIEAPSGSTKCASLPRVQSLDHANPS